MMAIFGIIGIILGLIVAIFVLFIIVAIIKIVFGGIFFMGGFVLKTICSWIFWVIAIVICIGLIL